MSKLIRRTAGMKKEVGAALIVALQMITLTLIGLMAPFASGPQQPANAPAGSELSASQAQPVSAPPAGAIRATKLYEPRATEVFNLATSRAESAQQSAQQSVQEGEAPNEATLTTDLQDYPPFSYVYFSGTGFEPGETVNMIVVQLDPNPTSYEPWDVVADENGNINTSWYIFSEELIGASMQATATGQTSGLTASATFTDGAVPTLHQDSGRTIKRDAFAWGDTVYLKGNFTSQGANRCYKVDWVNPSGTVVQTGNFEPGTIDTSASFLVPSGPSGVWEVRLYEASANGACSGATFPGYPGSPTATTKFDVAKAVIIGAIPSGGVGGDNNVNENQPNTVQNDNSGTTLSIDSKSGSNKRIFVRFDLTGAGISGTVNSALVRMLLFQADNAGFPRTHSAHLVTSTWLQSTITWNLQPTFNATATDSQSAPSVPPAALVRWSVTSDVQGFVNSTLTNYGWCIQDPGAQGAHNSGSYKATEANSSTDKTQGPVLLVDYTAAASPTPTPTATASPTPTATPTPTPTPSPTNLSVAAATGTYGGTVTLSATLTSNSSPVSGKTINFTLNGNPAGSGVTNASGVATSSAVTLCGSSYNVSGSPYSSGAAASFAGDTDYAATNGSNSLTVGKANATVSVTAYSVTYNGNPHTATVASITGVCGESGATVGTVDVSGTTHTNANTYNDTWTFTGTGNYNNIAATAITDTIDKADAVVVVTPYTCPSTTYTGLPHTATVTSITGVNGETGATVGTVDVSGTSHIDAGTFNNDPWTFTGTANYNNQNGTVNDCIAKADAVVVVTPYTCPATSYTGLAHTATYTVTGVNGETGATVGTVNVSGTSHIDAGTYNNDPWTFTGTANYNNQNSTVNDCIARANATVVVTAYTVTYNGLPHTATYTITGVNGETGATVGTVTLNTTHTNAGTYNTDSWFFTGTANYNDIASTTITDTINKAHLTVTADDKSKAYDGNPYSPFTATLSGFVNGETDSGLRGTGALSGAAGFTGSAVGATLPGIYTITPTVGTLSATNYDFPGPSPGTYFVNGTLTIGYGTCTGPTPGGVILPPINADGSSVYKRKAGSTIPVKFTVCDANGQPISNPYAVFLNYPQGGQLTMTGRIRGTVDNVNEVGDNVIPDVAFTFVGDHWQFNMATTNLDAGYTYTFRINLASGPSITFQVALK